MNAPPDSQIANRNSNWPKAFATAIGLCLGLAVIAALLYPVYAPSYVNSRGTHDLSNLKQSGVALLMYASDYDERFPVSSRWVDSLMSYTKNEDIFRSSTATPKNPLDYGFAFRKEFSLKPIKDFAEPEHQVALFDSTILSRNATSGLESLPKPGRYSRDSEPGNLFGYVDSHVRFIKDVDLHTPGPDGKPRIK